MVMRKLPKHLFKKEVKTTATVKEPCPYCGEELSVSEAVSSYTCQFCRNDVEVK